MTKGWCEYLHYLSKATCLLQRRWFDQPYHRTSIARPFSDCTIFGGSKKWTIIFLRTPIYKFGLLELKVEVSAGYKANSKQKIQARGSLRGEAKAEKQGRQERGRRRKQHKHSKPASGICLQLRIFSVAHAHKKSTEAPFQVRCCAQNPGVKLWIK